MAKRFVAIWFPYLKANRAARRDGSLVHVPFVLAAPDHGRMVIMAINSRAENLEIFRGMTVADARALHPSLLVLDDQPASAAQALKGLAAWCIRYSPFVCLDGEEGLILDASGCSHLWGGEQNYVTDIHNRLSAFGYQVRMGMADTAGAAWAASRFGPGCQIMESGKTDIRIRDFPAAALRLEAETLEKLMKLGLRRVGDFISMARTALRRRFGEHILYRIDQALGMKEELLEPVVPVEACVERLPCLEPIATRKGIEIALENLLEKICLRLKKEEKGLRGVVFKCFRIDGRMEMISAGTNRASNNPVHLFKLLELRIDSIEPDLGIEVFVLEAKQLEELSARQEKIWEQASGLQNAALAELLDRLTVRLGIKPVKRYLPDEHYWPENSVRLSASLDEKPVVSWKQDRPRPLQLLARPEPIEVTAPIPDYPPMLFRRKGQVHRIKKADGPERIEREWWMQKGVHRDYYYVEDEAGCRYWIFRSGHYDAGKKAAWFLHGVFP